MSALLLTVSKICVITLTFSLFVSGKDVGKLPYCSENFVPGLALVSTIDGKFSAVNTEGNLIWQIDTGSGPLLTSNIHNLELTNSGKWIRIIPSLSGTLYRFDGVTVDPIPISAESLLKSSFKYSDELVIAGGLEVQTYGIGFRTGNIFYTCSALKCTNNTYNEDGVENILLIERTTQIVRAVEAHSGIERWNFSVGHHNIKLPHVTCTDPNANLFDWNITAIIPDGLLLANRFQDNIQVTWQYHFPSPIVRIWKWNGHKISEIDLFALKNRQFEPQFSPGIYIGMHKKQLYIHESNALQYKIHRHAAVKESSSLAKIPWKPISASGITTEEDSTALSVLYSSEYVNGHGYYLYTETDINQKNSGLCKNNNTIRIPLFNEKNVFFTLILSWRWWKEVIVLVFTIAVIFHFMYRTFVHRNQQKQKVIFVERHVEVPAVPDKSTEKLIDSYDTSFDSRYKNDFVTLQCLGRGGFGIVFEVKQKIDECCYAIKRIKLPYEKAKRDTVMREVKALAKLEHNNIVRYFNSWVESPPVGWQQEHDSKWINETNEFSSDYTSRSKNELADVNIDIPSDSLDWDRNQLNSPIDSFITFENSCDSNDSNSKQTSSSENDEDSTKTELHTSENELSSQKHKSSDSGFANNSPVFLYIQMQLCKKQSLREWLVDNQVRNSMDILHIFKQIISAVEYVHLQGLIHRDLKPSNIFFSLDGQIKVGDFGLVKDMEDAYDMTTNSLTPSRHHTKEVGTRLYMSPEQLNGKKYNYKVDIYSLGLIFFELLIYFCTDMERINTLTHVRDNNYPKDFVDKYPDEHNLLTMMLCQLPDKRLTTFGVRARPPINCHDNYSKAYDFVLPKLFKTPT